MRCARCGNNNTEGNRFCGMCGAPLVAPAAVRPAPASSSNVPVMPRPTSISSPPLNVPPVAAPPTIKPAPSATGASLNTSTEERTKGLQPPDTIRRPEPPADSPMITGPSFLGLNTPGPSSRHHDSHSSSANLDYLLEDEEQPKRGWGKLILISAAIALALGFGYMHWKQGGFDWLTANNKKPAAEAAPDSTQNPDSGTASTPTAPEKFSDKTSPPSANSDAAAPASAAPVGSGPSGSNSAPLQPTQPQDSSPNSSAPSSDSPGPAADAPAASGRSTDAAPKKSADSSSEADTSKSESAPPAKPSAATKPREHNTVTPRPSAVKPVNSVADAERYIYGRGVTQDCDRGVHMLKAEQANPNALISLGTLYSTGTCTPRDLPTAYRWYALALHKQPDNQGLQDDLKKLWDKMTQPERQLAIKLSQ